MTVTSHHNAAPDDLTLAEGELTQGTQPAGTTVIQCSSVVCTRGSSTVLHDVSLQVRSGEVVALVGPNGAGKSTVLSVLAGDLPASSGSIQVLGEELSSLSTQELARRRAVLTQDNHVGFDFFASEVIEMGRAPWTRTPRADQDEAVLEAVVRTLGVRDFLPKLFNQLSGGERARVSMARVLAQETPILMLDEPTAALDLFYQEHLMSIARARSRQGVGVLVVVHDLGLAAAYADRVIMLNQGRIIAQGTPREVLTEERLSDVYRTPVRIVDTGDGSFVAVPHRQL